MKNFAAGCCLLLLTACTAGSEPIVIDENLTLHVERPGLLERAAITPERAREIALAFEPGTIEEAELEEEGERLLYAFDIRTADGRRRDIEVDAVSGSIVGHEEEGHDEHDAHERAGGDDEHHGDGNGHDDDEHHADGDEHGGAEHGAR